MPDSRPLPGWPRGVEREGRHSPRICVRFSQEEDAFVEAMRVAGGSLEAIALAASSRFARRIAKSSVQMALVRLAIAAEAGDD